MGTGEGGGGSEIEMRRSHSSIMGSSAEPIMLDGGDSVRVSEVGGVEVDDVFDAAEGPLFELTLGALPPAALELLSQAHSSRSGQLFARPSCAIYHSDTRTRPHVHIRSCISPLGGQVGLHDPPPRIARRPYHLRPLQTSIICVILGFGSSTSEGESDRRGCPKVAFPRCFGLRTGRCILHG